MNSGSGNCEFALICVGSEFVWECLCLGESSLVARRVYRRIALVCASGENVVCVTWCAEMRGLPARPIKSWCFPLTMSTVGLVSLSS